MLNYISEIIFVYIINKTRKPKTVSIFVPDSQYFSWNSLLNPLLYESTLFHSVSFLHALRSLLFGLNVK